MQIDFKKETVELSELKWHQKATLSVEGDVIVPDIKPDIREILLTEATPVITHTEPSGNKLNISGTINIHILYLSETESYLPKSMETRFDFKDSLDLPDCELTDITTNITTKHIEFSLINSRKLNAKIIVALQGRGYVKNQIQFLTQPATECPLKIRKNRFSTYRVIADTQKNFVISETLELPSTKPEINEIIKLNAKAIKGDCKIIAGKILLKGGLIINTLYNSTDPEAGIQQTEHELAFSESQDIEGLNEDCLCNVTYSVNNIFFTVKEDENGEDRLIALDIVLQAEIMASCLNETEVIDDCYSIVGQAKPEITTLTIDELITEGTSRESIKELLTIPDELPSAGIVYSLQCTPQVQEIKLTNQHFLITGKLIAFVLYGCVDSEKPIYSLVGEFDFEHKIPAEGIDDSAIYDCLVTEQGVSFTLNAASEIELRCVLEFYLRAIVKRKAELLTGCEIDETVQTEQKNNMVIYFARENDSLWDIAKHYKTDQESIVRLNKLEKPVLQAGQKILIPGPSHS